MTVPVVPHGEENSTIRCSEVQKSAKLSGVLGQCSRNTYRNGFVSACSIQCWLRLYDLWFVFLHKKNNVLYAVSVLF